MALPTAGLDTVLPALPAGTVISQTELQTEPNTIAAP
jgi:hypothetical protein